MGRSRISRWTVAIPLIWLLLFLAAPFVMVFLISLSEVRLAMPPYAPFIEWVADSWRWNLDADNYLFIWQDGLYFEAFSYSLKVAAIATLCCLLVGYPMAYAIAQAPERWRSWLLLAIILPFWTSFLLRVYAWIGLLKTDGLINQALLALGVITSPLQLLYTDFAVLIGIVYSYLPFMILPLYANLERHDRLLLEAAADLGASTWTRFWRITLPLSRPGVVAGCLLVFIPAAGEFVIPSLLGRSDQLMIGRVLADEFFANRDWPVAGAVAMILLIVLLLPMVGFQKSIQRQSEDGV
ncbi:MAG: ABC transporter permease [Steroidobacteraceae bacterium]|jgi:putrescine transport system permease protein|nr:ABC transporter permease subunit [Gammaproteobacteria bacterium]